MKTVLAYACVCVCVCVCACTRPYLSLSLSPCACIVCMHACTLRQVGWKKGLDGRLCRDMLHSTDLLVQIFMFLFMCVCMYVSMTPKRLCENTIFGTSRRRAQPWAEVFMPFPSKGDKLCGLRAEKIYPFSPERIECHVLQNSDHGNNWFCNNDVVKWQFGQKCWHFQIVFGYYHHDNIVNSTGGKSGSNRRRFSVRHISKLTSSELY